MRIANSISEKGKVLGRKRVRCCNGPDKDYSKKVRDNYINTEQKKCGEYSERSNSNYACV